MSRPEAGLEELRKAFDRAVYGAERRAWIIGLMGMVNTDGSVTIRVPDRKGWVYVTTGPIGNQMVTIARNDGKVALRDKMPVRMKRGDDNALVIYGIFNAGGLTDSGMSEDYENNFGVDWHHHRIGSGLEFETEGLMTERGRAYPTTAMNVYANPFRYWYDSLWRVGAGATIDLSGYQPATSGHWAWVVVGVDPSDGTLKATAGASQIYATELTFSQVNDVLFEGIPIVAIKVRNDATSLGNTDLFSDAHEWFAGLHYSKLGDLDNVDESTGYYGVGPYFNDELYFYGSGGYEWLAGGHKINMGAVKQLTLSGGVVDLGDGPTFGLIDVLGEGSADDDLVWIENGQVGDMVCLYTSDFVTNGEITVKITGNIALDADFTFDSLSRVLVLVFTPSGWKPVDRAGLSAMVTVPKSFEHYVDVKERLLENNVHGGLDVLATAQPLDSVPTDLPVTAGISKLLIAVIAGSDFDGEITVTGTTVNRDTATETPADTDIITVDALTTDASGTDGNGNATHAFTGAYITSKWFKGSVVLSTANLTLSDVDVYQISFEQFGDVSDISLETVDITAIATNNAAWMDLHLYSVAVTGSKVDITNEGTLELLASEVNSGNRYRKRLGDLSIPLDGTTDGFWFDAFWGPLANIYWEDINAKIWYTQQIDVVGDMVPGYYTNYIDFNVDYEDGVAEGRLQWNIDDGTLEVGMPGGQVNLQIGQEMLIRCRNTTGATILNGSVVEIIGASGNRPLISLADASDLTKISVIGMATEDIGHNSNGYVNTRGYVRDVNTSGMNVGEPVWLSATTPGAFTQTRPTAPDFSFVIGAVIVDGVGNGIVYCGPLPQWRIMDSSDVLFDATPADGEHLAFNLANGRFELTDAGGGNLDDLDDVIATSPTDNDEMWWDDSSAKWVIGRGHRSNYGLPVNNVITAGIMDLSIFPTRGTHDVRGESGNDDDLVSISNGAVGDVIVLFVENPSSYGDITVKTTGNINLAADVVLDSTDDALLLHLTTSGWNRIGGSGSGGASALDDLTDVNAGAPTDGQIIKWNNGAAEWQAADLAGGAAVDTTSLLDYLNSSKASADTPDDEFDGGSLDGKWTAVGGSAGTIDFLEMGDVAKYELDTANNILKMQAGDLTANVVELRQDFTLADGDSIIVAVSVATEYEDDTGSNNEIQCGLALNNNDAGYKDGTYVWLGFDQDAGKGIDLISYDGGTVYNADVLGGNIGTVFLRFLRDGSNYYSMYSRDGMTWTRLGTYTGTTYDNVWIFLDCGSTALNPPIPVSLFYWVRGGDATQFGGWSPLVTLATDLGSVALDDLVDVTIDGTPADDEVLAYDTGSGDFKNQTAAEAGLATAGHSHGAPAAARVNVGAQQLITLSGDTADVSSYTTISFFRIAAESGTADDLATMTAGADGDVVILKSDPGDTIDITEAGNFQLVSNPRTLDNAADKFICVWDNAISKWCELSQAGNA